MLDYLVKAKLQSTIFRFIIRLLGQSWIPGWSRMEDMGACVRSDGGSHRHRGKPGIQGCEMWCGWVWVANRP